MRVPTANLFQPLWFLIVQAPILFPALDNRVRKVLIAVPHHPIRQVIANALVVQLHTVNALCIFLMSEWLHTVVKRKLGVGV